MGPVTIIAVLQTLPLQKLYSTLLCAYIFLTTYLHGYISTVSTKKRNKSRFDGIECYGV